MDIMIDIKPEEDCQEECGSIYLTSTGSLVIHCTLCEKKYECYDNYVAHIAQKHIAPDFFPGDDFQNNSSLEDDFHSELDLEDIKDLENGNAEGEFVLNMEHLSSQHSQLDEEENFFEFERLDDEEAEQNYHDDSSAVEIEASSIGLRPLQRPSLAEPRGRTHKCPHCEFSCNDRSNLLGHIKRHSLNRPHKCVECSKCFYTRTELKAHIRMHTGERPYLCNECGKAFGTSSKLTLHRKRHANLRDKECPMCDMKFYSTTRLRDHMSVHSDDRPLRCDICDAAFKAYSSLKNHRKLHDNQRQYKCPLCPSSFNQNPGLYSHMKKKHFVVKTLEALEKDIKFEPQEL